MASIKKTATTLFLVLLYSISYSQETEWETILKQAIISNENEAFETAEEQFRKAQQLYLNEYSINDSTRTVYCNILYRRAHNLFMIEGKKDSSYTCFKELYDLSDSQIDASYKIRFRAESTILLSEIDLEKGRIRESVELLEKEKKFFDDLNSITYLTYQYQYYRHLASAYEYIYVPLTDVKEYHLFLKDYLVVRESAFYEEYIDVYKKLVNLSYRFNKDNINKKTEDLILLATHCRIPDDCNLAERTFDDAFSMWKYTKNHNNTTYLLLCKEYLAYAYHSIWKFRDKEKIAHEFDSILISEDVQTSIIGLMDFYSVRLEDESLNENLKEKYVETICDGLGLAKANNIKILHYICGYSPSEESLTNNIKIKSLIKFLSLCSIFYYDKDNGSMADLLLNKARYFSIFLPFGDRLLLEELNDAIAKSAEHINDEELYSQHKIIIIQSKILNGILPTDNDFLFISKNKKDINEKIESLTNHIKSFARKKFDEDLLEYYLCLSEAYLEKRDIELADENISIVDSIFKNLDAKGAIISNTAKNDLLLCKAKSALLKGDYTNAQYYVRKAYANNNKIETVKLMAKLHIINQPVLDSVVEKQYETTKQFIQKNYPFMSERERLSFSQSEEFRWFSNIPRYADKYFNDSTLLSLAYNSALISKETNISLFTETTKKIRENNDSTAKESLNHYVKTYTDNVNDTSERIRGNRRVYLEMLEKTMLHSSDISSHSLNNHFGNWENISTQLSENEIAIEFVEYPTTDCADTDNMQIGALCIIKNGFPKIIKICKVSQIDTLKRLFNENGTNALLKIHDIIWEPIIKEYSGTSKIWFSPSLHLYQINIESALPDTIDSYRLSSTRNILTRNDAPDFSKIALFGGLNYDDKEVQTNNTISNHSAYNIIRGSQIAEERVGLNYLKGSLNEVLSAEHFLNPTTGNLLLFIDKMGTEEHFKELSEKGISLLHIATHGFFINNNEKIKNVGSRIMRRSGLFMSGAKSIWRGNDEDYVGDDGILLSEEIECLDFSKLNLVVLSACGTGLGAPTNDGVYGLQRAFKKAGTQTIIMSLWNVDDNATALMMESFYKELVKTNSKHIAFRKAQNAVRKIYEDPYYWAAFIMLD